MTVAHVGTGFIRVRHEVPSTEMQGDHADFRDTWKFSEVQPKEVSKTIYVAV